MSKNKQRLTLQEFLKAHPSCCYCDGRRPAKERDHAPARIIFRGRHGPEGLEFPACAECNRSSALSEQVVAFYIRSVDSESNSFDRDEFDSLTRSIVNNAPDSIPIKIFNRNFADNFEENRVVDVPMQAGLLIELFGIKMLYAMHYKTTGRPAKSNQRRIVTWAQAGSAEATAIQKNAEQWFDQKHVGKRQNIELGNQFCYQTGYNAVHGFFGLQMSFGNALVFFCVLGPAKDMLRLRPKPPLYAPLDRLGRAIKPRNA